MPKKRSRSAVSGEFVTAEEADANPAETVTETEPERNLLDDLEALRPAIQAEIANQPDIIKAGLAQIDGAISTLSSQRWAHAAVNEPRVVQDA